MISHTLSKFFSKSTILPSISEWVRPAGEEYDRMAWQVKHEGNWDWVARTAESGLLGIWKEAGEGLVIRGMEEAARSDRATAERNMVEGVIYI